MFNEAVLTKKGIALNNKVQAGSATIEYLRVGLGKGIYEKNEKLEDQERLKEEKQSIPISSIKIIDEKTVKLRVVINNEEITEGYDITEIGLYATDPDEGEILYSVAIVDPLTTTSRISIISTRNSALYLSGTTTITGNDAVGVFVGNMSQVYIAIITGSGFTVGIYSVTGSRVSIVSNLISAITPYAQTGGGIFTHGNGTQISGLITYGLSCTWGTIYGGYIRHGNMNGVAMVTVQAQIAPSHTLTAGTDYLMPGFPTNAYTSVCVTVSPQRLASNCYISTSGTLSFAPMQDLQIGDSIALNCTYITNS